MVLQGVWARFRFQGAEYLLLSVLLRSSPLSFSCTMRNFLSAVDGVGTRPRYFYSLAVMGGLLLPSVLRLAGVAANYYVGTRQHFKETDCVFTHSLPTQRAPPSLPTANPSFARRGNTSSSYRSRIIKLSPYPRLHRKTNLQRLPL